MTVPSDGFLRARDIADHLGVPVSTVNSWRARGDGPPAMKVHGVVVYRISLFNAWLAEHEAKGSES